MKSKGMPKLKGRVTRSPAEYDAWMKARTFGTLPPNVTLPDYSAKPIDEKTKEHLKQSADKAHESLDLLDQINPAHASLIRDEIEAKLDNIASRDPDLAAELRSKLHAINRKKDEIHIAMGTDGSVSKHAVEADIVVGRTKPDEAMTARFARLGDSRPVATIVTEKQEKMNPLMFREFYPKVYDHLGNYFSPKLVAGMLSTALCEIITHTEKTHNLDTCQVAYKLMLPALIPLIEHKMPLLFLSRDLSEAIQRTDFHDDIDWIQLKIPYEHGIFILPHGALTHPVDGDVAFILWSRVQPKHYPVPVPEHPLIKLDHHSFAMVAFCPDGGVWYDSNLTDARPKLRLHNLFYRDATETIPNLPSNNSIEEDLTEEDAVFVEKMGTVVFGTFLALNARPELITPAYRSKVVRATKDKPAKEFWEPNIVGRNYRLKKESLGGSHASPRMHWRRGHYRNQPHGPARGAVADPVSGKVVVQRDYKIIWIEPMLVSAKDVPGKG